MSQPEHKVEWGWKYDDSQQAALELEELLHRHDMVIAPGSLMEAHVLEVMRLVYGKEEDSPPENDVREHYRTLVGVHDLAHAILAVQHAPSFPSLLPHLRLLSDGNALQNTPSSQTDQVTNKLFEVFAASLAMQCGTDVVLDHPTTSRGDNPDILGTLCGRRWGIACKVIHGLNPEGFIGHLEKALDQIEKSEAEVGVVMFNLKNVLPHNEIWPLGPVAGAPGELATGCWSDDAAPFGILNRALDDLGEKLVSYLPPGYLEHAFAAKKSVPGFLLWAPSVSAVRIDGRPTPVNVRALNFRWLTTVSTEVEKVLSRLTWAAYVGSDGRGAQPPC